MSGTKRCFFCSSNYLIDEHHIFGGAYRSKSTKYGLTVPLCHFGCHQFGKDSIHDGTTPLANERRLYLKQYGQAKVMKEQGWTRERFISEFGKDYLSMRTWRGV